jgi:SAM-dependent methyltransferase
MINYKLLKEIFPNAEIIDDKIIINNKKIPIENLIPRFTPNQSYSTGNFSRLRDKFAELQFDSKNNTTDRLNTILERTQWKKDFFKDKLILECGCGAGPDTEILLKLGAKVIAVDIAGLDIAQKNLGHNDNLLIIQADISDLPFSKNMFDIVWCHRVLQHTPAPEKVLKHILSYKKSNGFVFVHSYAKTLPQMFSWKYFLRPLTKNMNDKFLYKLVEIFTPPLFYFTCFLRKIPPNILGKILFKISQFTIPIRNYRFIDKFDNKDNQFIIEYAIHDTFDALSPKYDSPTSAKKIKEIAKNSDVKNFEVVTMGKFSPTPITLLRTIK